jgi:hypothetical protein
MMGADDGFSEIPPMAMGTGLLGNLVNLPKHGQVG